MNWRRGLLIGVIIWAAPGCDNVAIFDRSEPFENYDEFEAQLTKSYSRKPPEYSRAYRLMKRGAADAWLATIHGYPDNGAVCAELIEPYNNDPSLSVMSGTYYCEAIE